MLQTNFLRFKTVKKRNFLASLFSNVFYTYNFLNSKCTNLIFCCGEYFFEYNLQIRFLRLKTLNIFTFSANFIEKKNFILTI